MANPEFPVYSGLPTGYGWAEKGPGMAVRFPYRFDTFNVHFFPISAGRQDLWGDNLEAVISRRGAGPRRSRGNQNRIRDGHISRGYAHPPMELIYYGDKGLTLGCLSIN